MRSCNAFARRLGSVVVALVAAAAVAVVVAPPARADGELTLGVLMKKFAELPGLSAKFREEKQIALLSTPVRSEGEIHFAPPGRFLRKVTEPTPSAALIEGDRLVMQAEGERQEIDLTERPVVAGFVDSFRNVLAGDRDALQRTYELDLETGEGREWKLTLKPKSEKLRQFLTELELDGDGTDVDTMVMTEKSGDVTRTSFHDVRVHSWSDGRAERLFRIAP